MGASRLEEALERDGLWESLRALQPEIARLAAGGLEPTERQRQVVALLARIVAAELDFRAGASGAPS